MAHITIVGTSHISPESLAKVEKTIIEKKPAIVAVELDHKRLLALLSEKRNLRLRDIGRLGLKGWLFALIGAWAERKLGAKVGVSPGAEMLKAVELAHRAKAKIALIDQDIEKTLQRFSKELTWKEKWQFLKDIVKGLFGKGVQIDLAKVPSNDLIKKLIDDVRKSYPSVYKVLIEERNEFMARNLAHLVKQHPDATIVAVVGAGHSEELARLVRKYLKASGQEEKK